ncbi:MAG: hypothetical protein ABI237_01020 [Ginsengibacter sp.]
MKYLLSFFLFPATLCAQDISGVWVGHLYNDTTKQSLHYELAISEDNGKPSGYSHTTFVVDSTKKEVGVKEVKIKSKDGHYYIIDDKFVYDNYSTPPVKGIKVYSFLTLSENDSAEVLSGIWRTNGTKIYRPLTGTVFLEKKKKEKPEETLIVAKLAQLGLSDKLSFLPPSFASNNMLAINNKPNTPEKTIQTPVEASGAQNKEVEKPKEEPKLTKKEERAIAAEEKKEKENIAKSSPPIKKVIIVAPPAAEISSRDIETIRTVDIVQDSLIFSLYDNGTVDGDTVSVVINGKVVMPRVGLLERAINKTIYLTPDMGDSISVIMYAENLGSIPPNTGLLVVRDGEKNYEIRFTGDLKKNSKIILVRKKVH